MKSSIKVSILIPIYNVERYIGKCLDSVLTQTYNNVEYVFVDDCSTDNSLHVLKSKLLEYSIPADNYSIIYHSKNLGIAQTRIDLLAKAKGDYIQFIDSDDWIEKNMVAQMVETSDNGQIDIVGCNFNILYNNGITRCINENYSNNPYDNMLKCINYDIATTLWKLFIRKSLFAKFNIDNRINIGEDYIISIMLFYYANSFASVNSPLYNYVHANNNRLSYKTKLSLLDHTAAVKKIEHFFIEKGLLNNNINKYLNLRKFNIKSNYLTNRNFDIKAYITTFPEADKIWRQINYSRNEKIKFWLAEKKLYIFLKLIHIINNKL